MAGYYGFTTKAEYEAYYSDYGQYKHELQSMEDYCKEAELERKVMSTDTKACNLTYAEIMELIEWHGRNVADDFSTRIDRLGYLHKRLKAFQEEQPRAEAKPEANTAPATTSVQAAPVEVAAPNGWGQ